MDKYRILQVIGEGTYGKVFKAQEKDTGRVVAIKKFKQREDEDPHVRKTMMREIRILREYRHANIVNLRTVFRENGKLYLIFDYVQKTLLEELQATPDGLPFERIQSITYQILKANNFLHEGNIIHRDIKPENLLISKAGIVQLCDFGFARPLNSSPTYQYTDYVSTRWYRAPELLVGDAAYSGTVDVWAIGCIFAEIFNGMPLFPGDSDLHTLQLILETVTADDMEHDREVQELSKKQRVAFRMNPLFEGTKVPLASESIKSPETVQEVSLKSLLKGINPTQLDFIRKCLVIDGGERAKMTDLLDHPVFDEEFRNGYEAQIKQMADKDEQEMVELALTVQTTKDGRPELGPEDLVTEDEKDDQDDDDEFDDDDSSSAVGSPGDTSSVGTPGSSSGVEQNRMHGGGQQYHLYNDGGGAQGQSRDANELQSVKTAVPNIGDGLIGSEAASVEKLIAQNSMVSVSIYQQKDSKKRLLTTNADKVDSSDDEDDEQNKQMMMNSKNLELGSEDHMLGTQGSLQTQMLAMSANAEEQKIELNSSKDAKEQTEKSSEQLQITQGVNGTASLQKVSDRKDNPKTEPAKKEQHIKADPMSPPQKVASLEHHDIQVRVFDSQAPDYFPVLEAHASTVIGQQENSSQVSQHTTPQKARKRTSLNHYMIESSITEEIREENYSDGKTSSEKTSNKTPQHGNQSSQGTRDDHVIVREGVTSMFQHPASMGETEEGTENSPREKATATDIIIKSDQNEKTNKANQNQIIVVSTKANNTTNITTSSQIKIGAKTKNTNTKDAGSSLPASSMINSLTETKGTLGGRPESQEHQSPAIGSAGMQVQPLMSRAQTLDEGATGSSAKSGTDANRLNSNPIALKLQHTENFKQAGSSLTSQVQTSTQKTKMQQQAAAPPAQQQSAILASSSGSGAPQIRKVNITFGVGQQSSQAQPLLPTANGALQGTKQYTATQNSLMNLQMINAGGAVSRQSSQHTNNEINTTGNNTSLIASQVQETSSVKGGQGLGNSSRANVQSTNIAQQQRSSISLKQSTANQTGMHQTAREFTPHKKASLVAASPATIQQHKFGIEGSGIRQNHMDSTAAKTSQSRPGMQNNSLAPQEMSVTQFSGKPIYQMHQYPKTVVKGPGPKQTTVLKQTASLEKIDNRGMSPHKLPNLKPINSSMSQYGHQQPIQQQQPQQKPTTSDDQRVGEGLINLAQQHGNNLRQGPNSITNHFSSQQQRYPVNSNIGAANKLASGSTQSLTTKMNFTSQNYHRASNSQTNDAPSHHHLAQNSNGGGGTGPINKQGHLNNGGTIANSIAANSAKKSQLIHPLKIVAFPKLMHNDESQMTKSPKNNNISMSGVGSKKQSNVSSNAHQHAVAQHYHNKPAQQLLKKLPHHTAATAQIIQQQQQLAASQQNNNQNNNMIMSSKTQATKMPKRYSDMGMLPTTSIANNSNQSKFAGVPGNGAAAGHAVQIANGEQGVASNGHTFHPTLTNEYMLSQDSLVLNEVNSRPSRQSSNNLEQPSASQKNQQNSVESHRPRNQATSHMSSNTKSRGGPGPNSQVPANQSFHSTMKSKNNKFIHQNSSTSHHPTKGPSVNQSGILVSSTTTKAPPATSDKKIHQHFLEEFNEATSQRASIARPKNMTESLGISQTHQKTPMTSLFQKSKFFQSQSSNAENTNPNSLNVPSGGYHQHQISNHYGQQYQGQSTSPTRTLGNNHPGSSNTKQQEIAMLSNFTDKDSFPRRNITNKLRNASNLQHKKTKFNQLDGQQHASTATSPSPLSLHQREAKNAGGIVLPNLGTQVTSAAVNNNAQQQIQQPTSIAQATAHSNGSNAFMNVHQQHQQHIMQVSLTQLHATANDPRSNNLSQSPNIVRNKEKTHNLGTQKLSAVANVVQLNASEFNLRLTNNSQLSASGGAVKGHALPYQQIVRKPPSVIQPGRAQQYQMYLTPSQNYTSGTTQSVANRAPKNTNQKSTTNQKQGAQGGPVKISGTGSSPTALNKKISYENSFNVQKIKNQVAGGPAHRSPVMNGGSVSYKVKTETDWHRGSQQQLFDVSSLGQSNQLYRVSNQLLEKSISPQRIQQAMKRGSNVQMMSSQGGIAIVGGPAGNNYTENKINFSNQQQKRRQTGVTVDSGHAGASGAASSGIIHDSSQDSLPVQSPNLLRKKFISKQQNQIK